MDQFEVVVVGNCHPAVSLALSRILSNQILLLHSHDRRVSLGCELVAMARPSDTSVVWSRMLWMPNEMGRILDHAIGHQGSEMI